MTVARVVDTPVSVATVQGSPSGSDRDIMSRVESLFQSFSKSLEVRFSSIDERFSQVIGSSSNANDNRPIVSSQYVTNPSIPAPTPVAVRYEHPPARAPYAPFSDGLGKSREGPAALRPPVGVTSLPKLAFSNLIDRVYESSMGIVPDSFLDSLCSFVVYFNEFDVAIQRHSFLVSPCSVAGVVSPVSFGCRRWTSGEGIISSGVDGIPASSLASSLVPAPFAFSAGSPFPAFPSVTSVAPSVASFSSLPLFSFPAPSFAASVAYSFPSAVFPSPTLSHPAPPAIPRAPALLPLASFLPFRPPFASGSTPYLSLPISSILSSAPSLVSLGSFTPTLAPVSASSHASCSSPLPFVSSASLSSTVVSCSLPAVVSCSAPSLASLSALVPSVAFPQAAPPPPSALFPPVAFSFSSALPLPSIVPSWGVPGVSSSPLVAPSGFWGSASGVCLQTLCGVCFHS